MANDRVDPLTSFRFVIEIEDDEGAIQAAFSSFSGIKIHTEIIKVRSGSDSRGVMTPVPARTQYENVKLTKGVIGGNELLEWLSAVAPGHISAPSGRKPYRQINIYAVDAAGDYAVCWTLYQALPVAYELSQMDALTNAVLSESIEFAYTGFKRTIMKG
ncbi:MAG: phage tail protein [Oscillospiraceae bacterium]|jgi:phage tail-like protein|nr:phage tail protein [Oscillospiraceae bacterium]